MAPRSLRLSPRTWLRRLLRRARSLQVLVPAAALLLVVGTAVIVSANVAGHLEQAATDEAVRAVGAVVSGSVDPSMSSAVLDAPIRPDGSSAVDRQLEGLTRDGRIVLIKVWRPDGTVVFSNRAVLRGRALAPSDELNDALRGKTATEITRPDAAENAFDGPLPPLVLEIYEPIVPAGATIPIGAYEIYQDAGPLAARIEETRRDVLLIVGALGLLLLGLLWGAFKGANRLLADLAARLRGSERRFRSLVQNSSDLLILVDTDGRISYASPAVGGVLGWTEESVAGAPLAVLAHPDDAAWLDASLSRITADPGKTHAGEVRLRHADGRWRWIEMVGSNLLADDAVGSVILNCRDVTERRELEDQLRHRALEDPLTGLANRALLIDRLEHDLARRDTGADLLAVVLLDLDDFKTVNDGLGHAAGDALLVAVANRLRAAVPAGDTAARLGGDEFVVLLHAAGREALDRSVATLLGTLREPVDLDGHRVSPSASAGIAFIDARDAARPTAEEVLRNADAAMYMAKARGKGVSAVFVPAMHEAAVRRLHLKEDLARALERREFSLRYQPIVRLATGETIGVEALVRWERPGGTVLPDEFIPIAEETGLIVPLGRWVLEEACRAVLALEQRTGRRLDLAVNVSPVQMLRPEIVGEVAAALRRSGLESNRLTLELTESLLVDRSEALLGALSALHGLGARLAIDDFGTGYSSLSYLPDLPVDTLKIDRSFVGGLDAGRESQVVIRSIIRMADSLHLATVAEGIERPEQAARLRTLGAELGQGYHFARPLTIAELADHLAGSVTEIAG